MLTHSDAYARGHASGKRARAAKLFDTIAPTLASWKAAHPLTADLDLAQELVRLDKDRVDAKPDPARYPEARGWADLVLAERKGFTDGSGCDALGLAFRYTSFYFSVYRLYTRYQGNPTPGTPTTSPVGSAQCTAVFFRDSKEGGPLYGRNCDNAYNPKRPTCDLQPPRRGPDGQRRVWCKGVSCWTMCDEEPPVVLPALAWHMIPDDCRKLPDVIAYITRYVHYGWAGNGIIVDTDLNSVAYERTSSRIAFRHSPDGTAAVTACACVIPEMHAFRESCLRRALDRMGYSYKDNNFADRNYWSAAELRYHRLLKLVREAAARGPSLQDLASIMTDTAVPAPDRICIAGESCHPAIPVGAGEWTIRSRSVVLEGPNRRTLFWPVNGSEPCYVKPPYLIPGEGVEVKPEWKIGTRPVPPAVGPDDELEAYRQYEFDYPDHYPS